MVGSLWPLCLRGETLLCFVYIDGEIRAGKKALEATDAPIGIFHLLWPITLLIEKIGRSKDAHTTDFLAVATLFAVLDVQCDLKFSGITF